MILVSKEEAKKIREKIPDAHLKRTVHKYYAEERLDILRLLGRVAYSRDVNGRC